MRHSAKTKVLQRIAALENQQHKDLNKPYALFPVRKSLEDWELLAVPKQAHLKANVKTGEPVAYA
ncbi:hypothetical protein [Alteromonas sp. OM2203]|uniref:hypothetical protein n=1 Tax=Alteromonas sp. OM2203 TaxID=3398817 RepID=UPI003AF339C3